MNFFRTVHELFFISFSLGRFFFKFGRPLISFLIIHPFSEIKMTGMLLNVGHLQVHKNISQGRLTAF